MRTLIKLAAAFAALAPGLASAAIVDATEPLANVVAAPQDVTFDLGASFSSINSVTFTFSPCGLGTPGCIDTLGTGEFVNVIFGAQTIDLGLGVLPLGTPISAEAFLDAANLADLLDGVITVAVLVDTALGFFPQVLLASLTITVDGVLADTSEIPLPAGAVLLLTGVGALAARRRRRQAA